MTWSALSALLLLGVSACQREPLSPTVATAPARTVAPAQSRSRPVAKHRRPAVKPAAAPVEPTVAAPLPGGKVRDCKEYFATLEDRFEPSASKDLHAVFQFDLSGPNACAYHVEVDNGTMKLQNGRAAKADVTISASAEDYIKVVNGEMGGVGAVMSSKMKVRGDLALAGRMKKIFPAGDKDK
jgi:putative sterol carrier protein